MVEQNFNNFNAKNKVSYSVPGFSGSLSRNPSGHLSGAVVVTTGVSSQLNN